MTRQVRSDVQETINTRVIRLFEDNAFNASWLTPEGSSIADNGVFGIVLLTKDVETLLDFKVAVGGNSEVKLYEAPSLGTTGTALTIYNANRSDFGRSSQFLAWHTPANVTGTVLMEQLGVLAGEVEDSWVLKTGTYYAIVGVNRSGGSEMASVWARWYETDGET